MSRIFKLITIEQAYNRLITFYNASLTNKIVISDWKVSKVTPIYKGKGNNEEAGNYRPISLIGHNMTYSLYYNEDI